MQRCYQRGEITQNNSSMSEIINTKSKPTDLCTKEFVHSDSNNSLSNGPSQNQLQAIPTSLDLNKTLSAQSKALEIQHPKPEINNQVCVRDNGNPSNSNGAISKHWKQDANRSGDNVTSVDSQNQPSCSKKEQLNNDSSVFVAPDVKSKPLNSRPPKVSAISFNKSVTGQLGAGMVYIILLAE